MSQVLQTGGFATSLFSPQVPHKNHQRILLAIFVELEWADGQFISALKPIADKYGLSRRALETAPAKTRRMGFIDHVSRFNETHSCRESWVFSNKFSRALVRLAEVAERLREKKNQSRHGRAGMGAVIFERQR